ncbi:hypothetical protein [Streptomyces sp. NPDC059786]
MTDLELEQLLIIVDRGERGAMLPAEASRLRAALYRAHDRENRTERNAA